jgi:hypothetical protein
VKIPFTELSPEIQTKFGYNPQTAADFQQKTYQADVASVVEIRLEFGPGNRDVVR